MMASRTTTDFQVQHDLLTYQGTLRNTYVVNNQTQPVATNNWVAPLNPFVAGKLWFKFVSDDDSAE